MHAASIAGQFVRVAAVSVLAIFCVVLVVSPAGLAAALAFFAPVFAPALVGMLMGLLGAGRRTSRAKQVVAAGLMIPGLALATWFAIAYSPHHSDRPAAHGEAAARAVEFLGPVGVAAALAAVIAALLRRSRTYSSRAWPVVIATLDLLVLVTALSVSVPG
jgi:hypothetical protein